MSDPNLSGDVDAGSSTDGNVSDDADAMDEVVDNDVEPPETTIDSAPESPSNSRSGTLAFSSSEANSTFMCKVGLGSFESCTSPVDVSSDSDGPKLFEVYAIDAADNADPTPATYAWNVDTKSPVVTVSSGPNSPTNLDSATLSFSADEVSSFECSVDGGAYSSCESPKAYTGLGQGEHRFDVRATDMAGNQGADEYLWAVDAAAPSLDITGMPSNPTRSTTADFVFEAEAGTRVECRIDSGSYAACTSSSTQRYLELEPNRTHLFEVRATDGAGNSATASYSWNIDTRAPDVNILVRPNDPTNSASAAFSFSVDEVATMECALDGVFTACAGASSHSFASLSDGRYTFTVRATDTAGNAGSDSYSWSVDTTPPPTSLSETPADPYPVDYVRFRFSSTDSSASFQCSIDGGAYSACTSPKSYRGLGYLRHTFLVRAVDTLNNVDETPASHSWTAERGLVLHYPFEGDLRNASALGRSHDGGGAGFDFIAGVVGRQAIAFDGSARALAKLGDTGTPMSNDDTYSIGMYLYEPRPVIDTEVRELFNFMDRAGGITAFRQSSRAGELRLAFTGDDRVAQKSQMVIDASETWQHLALVYQRRGGNIDVYLNAVYLGAIENSTGAHIYGPGQLSSMLLGVNSGFAIDELQVYNHALSIQQVCEQMMGRLWVDGRVPYCK